MAQFIGFECDSCGQVISAKDRNKITHKFDGPAAKGEYVEDRCSECVVVPPHVEMKPLRRRRTQAELASTG